MFNSEIFLPLLSIFFSWINSVNTLKRVSEMMTTYAKKAKKGAVIGGALLGLEAAKAMIAPGVTDTSVIEFAPGLMPCQIDETGSNVLKSKLETLSLKILTNTNTVEILGDGHITGMQFANDTKIDVDTLVISTGIKSRDELAKLAGIETGTRGGIVVNEKLQTSDENIYAIGECALFEGMIYGLVAPGYEMAQVVVDNIASLNPSKGGSLKISAIDENFSKFIDLENPPLGARGCFYRL